MAESTDDAELPSLPAGTVLEGRYRIAEEIGAGGIGRVYRAEHLKLGHDVAIKALLPEYAAHTKMRPRFEREAKALASLHHPHIVTLLDYSISKDGAPYLVMELLSGRTLDARLAEGPLPEEVARQVALQTVEALVYAHGEGFVHRDLKPANIFLSDLPTDPNHVKLLDFGFVKLLTEQTAGQPALTQSGIAFGTPSYMSPEQATGGAMDPRTDVYSFGVILFEMIAGRRPFVGSLPEIVRQHLTADVPPLSVGDRQIEATPELRALLERAMAKEPDARFESAEALCEALRELPSPWVRESKKAFEPTLPAVPSAQPSEPEPRSAPEPAAGAQPNVVVAPGPPPVGPAPSRQVSEPTAQIPRPPRPSRAGGLGLGLLLVAGISAAAVWWFGIRPASMAEAGMDSLRTAMGAEPAQTDPAGEEDPAPEGELDDEAPLPAPDSEDLASLLDEISGDVWMSEQGDWDEPSPETSEEVAELEDEAPEEGAEPGEDDVDPEPPAADPDAPRDEPEEAEPPALDPEASLADAEPELVDEDEAGSPEEETEEDPEEAAEEDPEEVAEEDTEEEEPLGPNPWRTRPVERTLVNARRRVLRGRPLSTATTRALRRLVRQDRGDPRPHLLIAQSFVAEGRGATALERYDLAHRVDESARGDPRMLFDLIRLATEDETSTSATAMIRRVYADDALPFLDELIEDEDLPEERVEALRSLRDRLEEPSRRRGDAREARRARVRRARARARIRRARARARRARARRARARRARARARARRVRARRRRARRRRRRRR